MKPKRQQTAKVTVSGTITKAPQRVRMATGKAMATMVIQAESELRSPYPLTLVAYDDDALGADDQPERKQNYRYWLAPLV